ncbi:hypothetical protein LCGC14_2303770 [marine sediment metagenome]|uniref:PilZ domain-containing protein n=1 Tax=marine sediment metagenome TaxID=412755 RepID=A0A0F9F027_9ZZZZ
METNKRSQVRVKVEGEVRYTNAQTAEPEKHQKRHRGEVVDISPDGICISTKHEFKRGSTMEFSIIKHFESTFTGIVRWCKKHTVDKFHVGLKVPFK